MSSQTAVETGDSWPPPAVATDLYRQGFGVLILFAAGFFWVGWGYGWVPNLVSLSTWSGAAYGVGWLVVYAIAAVLLVWAVRTWRGSKTRLGGASLGTAELWTAGPFRRVIRYEAVAGALVFLCAGLLHRWDLLAPGISVVVGLHFLPLGAVFRTPAYFVLGAAVVIGDVVWLMLLTGPARTVATGVVTGAAFWATGLWILFRFRGQLRHCTPHRDADDGAVPDGRVA